MNVHEEGKKETGRRAMNPFGSEPERANNAVQYEKNRKRIKTPLSK